jgi:hypothetical protein
MNKNKNLFFFLMATLPYTNGKDGNGITDLKELIHYFISNPLALFDCGFLRSYYILITHSFEKRSVLNLNVEEEQMLFQMYDNSKIIFID